MKIYSCLFVVVLGCNITAGIIHEEIQEKDSITLCCPHPVGQSVTWSRERGGNMVDVLLELILLTEVDLMD
ncbi:uncharacterized protein AKAME5_001152300 [Lates japonicus]|uniref:Uncharacterized protein n=1 Tax=Lates japonicus TaxID=270547 RepID=A0AAD3MTF8_LATJO|nr:uncharacterized protein AKAME5_001152300 [Lates japonicus]